MFRHTAAVIFAIFFMIAGVYHFTAAQGFADMIPFLPFPLAVIYVTAVVEFILAVLIIVPKTRESAGLWTSIYLVLIFPANVYAAVAGVPAPGQEEANDVLLWVRLLFQPLLIWWIWWATRKRPKLYKEIFK